MWWKVKKYIIHYYLFKKKFYTTYFIILITFNFSLYCGNPADYNLPLNETEINIPEFYYGYESYDNILVAMLSVF